MNRVLSGIILAALGAFAVGCCSSGALVTTPCDSEPRNHVIEVAQKVSCKEAYLSKASNHHVTWKAERGSVLKIDFGADNPFPNLKCPHANLCESGAIARDAAEKAYAYRVWLNGTEIDPNIIIKP